MPPKVAPVAAPVGKKISVTVKVSKPADYEDGKEQAPTKGLRMRAFTTWPDSISAVTTPMFGEKDGPFAWKEDGGSTKTSPVPSASNSPMKPPVEGESAPSSSSTVGKLVSTMQYNFVRDIKDDEGVRNFHDEAGIYFTFQYVDTKTAKIVNLFYVDCSIFLVDCSQPIQLHRRVYEKYEVDITVSMEETFKTWNDLLPLNPLVIRLKR